jgi:hypothetical protein
MKKSLRILVALSIAASSIIFVPSATAAIGTLYSSSTGNGDVACTTGFFTIESNVVIGNTSCAGTVAIPDSVTSIGNLSFFGASGLTSLTIGSSVSSIGSYAFYGTNSLTSLTIPNSVRSIGEFSFFGTSGLTSLTIGSSVSSIGLLAFYNANRLTSLTIPNSVTSLGQGAFRALSRLTSLTLGTGLTSITADAFAYPTALISVTIPSSVISIGDGAFYAATSLTSLTISSGITSIGAGSFLGASSLTSLTIPTSVTSISSYAFYGASSLTSLTIPSSVTSIGAFSFTGTSSLSSYQYCGSSLTTTALSNAGLGSKTITGCAPVVTVPSAPTSVVATATGKRSATVSFAAPASNGGSAVTSYTATSTPGGLTQTLAQATGGSFNFDGLQPSTAYTFAVTANNAIGTSAAATSNSVSTAALAVASLSALSFIDDGNGTSGKIIWAGTNIDSVLYKGPELFYPGPFKYGAFTSGWNGRIRKLIPNTTYEISIVAFSADGVGGEKSLTFTTNTAPPLTQTVVDSTTGKSITTPLPVLTEDEKLAQLLKWVNENTYVTGEASNMSGRLTNFAALETSPYSSTIRVPLSSVSTVVATSLTPLTCSVNSATAAVEPGLVTALSGEKCTISYTVNGGSNAPATLVRDFYFKTYVSLPMAFACGAGFYTIKAGVVSAGSSCTGAVTIDASATSIGPHAFVNSSITSITIPNSVTKIGDAAFINSTYLIKVELGNAVTSIGNYAFYNTKFPSISLPTSLRTIGIGAFMGSGLTSLIIPVGTTTVGFVAFVASASLITVTVPSTITFMDGFAFMFTGVKSVNYCGSHFSVLSAIERIGLSPTCVTPATAPETSSNSNP